MLLNTKGVGRSRISMISINSIKDVYFHLYIYISGGDGRKWCLPSNDMGNKTGTYGHKPHINTYRWV